MVKKKSKIVTFLKFIVWNQVNACVRQTMLKNQKASIVQAKPPCYNGVINDYWVSTADDNELI